MLDFGYYNMDCMEGMKDFPDKYFDLAIVDPPYGGGSDEYDATTQRYGGQFDKYFKNIDVERMGGRTARYNIECERTGGQWASKYQKNINKWDVAPPQEYFDELFRISKNQIIWGGNYFGLPPTRCFIIWRKLTISESFSMAMAEYAWTSFNSNAKVYEYAPQDKTRFHPTQKPVELYKWLLENYAKKGDLILDTHVGSASSLIACEDMGFKYVGFEIDKDYYEKGVERIKDHTAQVSFFNNEEYFDTVG